MEWNKFRSMSDEEKVHIFYPSLRKKLQNAVNRYNKDFPEKPFKDDTLDLFVRACMEFVLLSRQWSNRMGPADGTQDWCDQKREMAPELTGAPPSKGGFLLGLIRYHGRLAFGWRLHKKNSSCAPGLMQIIMDYFENEQHLIIPWLISTPLNALTTADAVREFQSCQMPTAERYSMNEDALRQMIKRL